MSLLLASSILIAAVSATTAKSVDAQFRHKMDADKMFLPFTLGFLLFVVFMAAVNVLSRYVDKRTLLEMADMRLVQRIRAQRTHRHTRVEENGRTVLL